MSDAANCADQILVALDQHGVVGVFRTFDEVKAALGPFPATAPEVVVLRYPCAGAEGAAVVYAPPYRRAHVPAFVVVSAAEAETLRAPFLRAGLVDPDDIEQYWALKVGECTLPALQRMRELEEWTELKQLGEEVVGRQLAEDKKTIDAYLSGGVVDWEQIAPAPAPFSISDAIVCTFTNTSADGGIICGPSRSGVAEPAVASADADAPPLNPADES